jgi:hypothetical protein
VNKSITKVLVSDADKFFFQGKTVGNGNDFFQPKPCFLKHVKATIKTNVTGSYRKVL